MILFNTTFLIESKLEEQLLDCIKSRYVPEILKDEVLVKPALHRIHRPAEAEVDEDYSSFALHFYAPSLEILNQYLLNKGEAIRAFSFASLAGRLLHFSSTMDCLELANENK